MLQRWNTGILGLSSRNRSYAFLTSIPLFHAGGLKPVMLKAACFQYFIEIPRRHHGRENICRIQKAGNNRCCTAGLCGCRKMGHTGGYIESISDNRCAEEKESSGVTKKPLKDFQPSEKIEAEQAVDFPYDI
jgi:hypothetical protein